MSTGSPPFRVKALYDYPGSHEDDLSFSANQTITVTEEEDADWYNGHYEDSAGTKKEGIFPKNFVKFFEPETPPRPVKSARPQKDADVPPPKPTEVAVEEVAREPPKLPEEQQEVNQMQQRVPPGNTGIELSQEEHQPPAESSQPVVEASLPKTATKPQPPARAPSIAKAEPPAAVEKPTTGSFRDRINAFNKPTAPPVAPIKPGALSSGGSGFIKKPFVAPPPSKNAYIPPPREPPPQRVYRREEDPEVTESVSNDLENDAQGVPVAKAEPSITSGEEEVDQPKPTSLKDRIALLQKQQAEQAARHSETAKKKEKPKRPAQQRTQSQDPSMEQTEGLDDPDMERDDSGDRNLGVPQRSNTGAAASPVIPISRSGQYEINDTGHSDGGYEEQGDEAETVNTASSPTGRPPPSLPQRPQTEEPDTIGNQEAAEESEDSSAENEEDVDPEVKRRMEIRERMAKMSGGMGMAGMFGPPGGLPPKKQSSMSSEKRAKDVPSKEKDLPSGSRAPPIPMMPMPGMAQSPRPRQSEHILEPNLEPEVEPVVDKEPVPQPTSIRQGREPEEMPDMEDLEDAPVPSPRTSKDGANPADPRTRPVPPPPQQRREAPPSQPVERAPPPVPANAPRPPAPQTPHQILSPSEGSASDDEMSATARSGSYASPKDESRKSTNVITSPMLPHRPRLSEERDVAMDDDDRGAESEKDMPTSPVTSSPTIPSPPKRSSAVPPIPSQPPIAPSHAPHGRAPPPPPPDAPPSRVSTGETRIPPPIPQSRSMEDDDHEVTEYEGDYDTDIAADTDHKDALNRHERTQSTDRDSAHEDDSLHHAGLPGLGPAPRAVPPAPPSAPPTKAERISNDIPRGPPPPIPPTKDSSHQRNESYDPFNYMAARPPPPMPPQPPQPLRTNTRTSSGPQYSHSGEPTLDTEVPPLTKRSSTQHSSSPLAPPPAQPGSRQSADLQRNSSSMRRSMDAPRPSGEHGSIASDIDLDRQSQWWTQPSTPPPSLQSRKDIIYEIEDTNTTRRGGRQNTTRVVYVLYTDYSQTNISVHYDPREPSEASFEQHHEPPPARLRQDQLEEASTQFGTLIAQAIATKKETTVGDGSPQALISDLLQQNVPSALPPIGNRSYGSLIYANLANASVQQFDEIRPGDIVTFRNAKFQGHKGAMHAKKYSIEVGKPGADHVGVVEDWDGTKKKIRAWEQGRESRKVRLESFKLGDMRSGECKVWRVMGRGWVGWEG